jgi:hypothetical protein
LLKISLQDEQRSSAQPTAGPSDRLLLLVFQAHVDPGNFADQMVGVRLHVIEGNDVRVIRLHPTRNYDVDNGSFSEAELTSAALTASASGNVAGKVNIGGSGSSAASEEDQVRQRYISHIGKIASFADAGNQTFGFNFYPSNIQVERIPWYLAWIEGKTYEAHGYLEGGAHDCAAIVVVPRTLTQFTCRISYVTAPTAGGGSAQRFYLDKEGIVHSMAGTLPPTASNADVEQIVVKLPPWNPVELLAATAGAAPVEIASTQPASTQPVDYTVIDIKTVSTQTGNAPDQVTKTTTETQHIARDHAKKKQPVTQPIDFTKSACTPTFEDYVRPALSTQPTK